MAIFPEYAMPKYKSPIRITKPYQKPNYLADAIIGGMGAYTNMQGMNLKKQMFMAQMAQQQKAIADREAQAQWEKDYITGRLGRPTQYGGGVQAQSPEAFYEGYQGDVTSPIRTAPFEEITSRDDIVDALKFGMQTQNPLANVARALQLQGLIDPKPKAIDPLKEQIQMLNVATKQQRLDNLREKATTAIDIAGTNFLERFDAWVEKPDGYFSKWDTEYFGGGGDLTGLEARKALGMTVDNPEYYKVRQLAKQLYLKLKKDKVDDPDDVIKKIFIQGASTKPAERWFDPGEVSQQVNIPEIAKLIQEYGIGATSDRAKGHNVTLRN